MKVTLLGCGTSSGVPRIGNDWGSCDSRNPRNRRTRVSILVESPTTRILVDTSPDLRQQLLANEIGDFDAVLWTHDHADHSHGIDDLRVVMQMRGEAIAGFARPYTADSLRRRFSYVFKGNDGYPSIATLDSIDAPFEIGDIRVDWIDMPHGPVESTGFKFRYGRKTIAYATDFSDFTYQMRSFFHGLDIWVVDALRERPHRTHPNLAMTLAAIGDCAPKRAILTHMDNSMDYDRLLAKLPPTVVPGYDGMIAEA